MQKIEYDLPVFNDKDVADLNKYSQLVANALKVQIDKFGQPLTFKGTVDTMTDLQNIQTKTNGDIYEVKDIEQLYIYNGNEWVIYSDTLKIKIEGFDVIKVETLPTENIQEKTIYLVPNTQAKENNIYDEYIYVNSTWEIIGSTAVDLTDYYNKTEVDNLLDDVGDTLPIGSIVEYEGDTVPDGFVEVENPLAYKKTTSNTIPECNEAIIYVSWGNGEYNVQYTVNYDYLQTGNKNFFAGCYRENSRYVFCWLTIVDNVVSVTRLISDGTTLTDYSIDIYYR